MLKKELQVEIDVLHRQGKSIRQIERETGEIRPARPQEPIQRFETDPAKQLQIDFVVFRRGMLPLRAFTAELGFSRYSYVEFTDNEAGVTLVACLERALQYFGGVPDARAVRQSQNDRRRAQRLRRRPPSLPEGLARFRQALRRRGQTLRTVSSTDQRQGRAFSPLLARIVLQPAASRTIRACRRCVGQPRGTAVAR